MSNEWPLCARPGRGKCEVLLRAKAGFVGCFSSFVCHNMQDSDPPPTLLKGNLSQGGGNCAYFQINLREAVKSIVGKSSPLHAAEPVSGFGFLATDSRDQLVQSNLSGFVIYP